MLLVRRFGKVYLAALCARYLHADAQTLIQCPSPTSQPTQLSSGSSVLLRQAGGGELCILAKVFTNDDTNVTRLIPAGRSYDGHDWERVAGGFQDLNFSCNNGDCSVDIPETEAENDAFKLFGIVRKDVSRKEEVSRFLEQASFGPTQELIDQWDYTNFGSSFAQWVKTQMDDVEATEHRVSFRSSCIPEHRTKDDIGRPKNPCEIHSRWRMHAITEEDKEKTVEIRSMNNTDSTSGPYYLLIDGAARTVVDKVVTRGNVQLEPGFYDLCHFLFDGTGGRLYLKVDGKCERIPSGNPPVHFPEHTLPPKVIDFPSEIPFKVVNEILTKGSEVVLDTDDFSHPLCGSTLLGGAVDLIHGRVHDGTWYTFDPRAVLRDNTLMNPIPDGGGKQADVTGTRCSNVPRTFLNEESCRLSTDISSCGSHDLDDVTIEFNNDTLPQFLELTGRYVYVVSKLKAEASPCTSGAIVRWRVVDDTTCASSIDDPVTADFLQDLIITAEVMDSNSYIKDIEIPKGSRITCLSNVIGTRLLVNGTCYEHVHPDHYNVYDFTGWGVSETETELDLFKKTVESGNFMVDFPYEHERWEDAKQDIGPPVARYGDSVEFPKLPDYLRREKLLEKFAADAPTQNGAGVIVCGSPGEVANKHVIEGAEYDAVLYLNDKKVSNAQQRRTIWLLNALYAKDQLRQRVAHALSQTMVISGDILRHLIHQTEVFVTFHDILVRNAFGNYRDILKEVSYSPMMAEMLSYCGSRGELYSEFPDENYAREIMQLFTMGTVELHDDGTPVTDSSGHAKPAYSNDDIMQGARAWTGFRLQLNRGNMEVGSNMIDPMKIERLWRDRFPKMLLGSYIGDGYPLCADLPEKPFLRVGARYRLLGSRPTPELQYDDPSWALKDTSKRLVLNPDHSELFQVLCNDDGNGCNFSNSVVLDKNLGCHGRECKLDAVRVVQVSENVFYEYVRVPCVETSFFNNGRKIKAERSGTDVMCADPRIVAATESCCVRRTLLGTRACQFFGERMTYKTAMDRCADKPGARSCDYKLMRWKECGECCNGYRGHHWTTAPCTVQVKVNKMGKVAIVHEAEGLDGEPVEQAHVHEIVNRESFHWFPVQWTSGNVTELAICEKHGGIRLNDDSCLYKVTEVESPVFHSSTDLASMDAILSHCHVGAFNPAMFDGDNYKAEETLYLGTDAVTVWVTTDGNPYDVNTIFQVTHYGKTKFFRNVELTVELTTSSSGESFAFRNTPQFINLLERDLRDVQYETEAVIDRYFYHDNTAPHLATRMIQRLGFSNPSPRFVKVVASAFRDGNYLWTDASGTHGDISFGSSQYGDLEAMIAAILLDREARSPVLDADPSYGSIREPLLKVVHFMRALELEVRPDFMMYDVEHKIGQMQYTSESIFSWFESDFSPVGPINAASLHSPEATIMNTPNVLGLMSGLLSLVKYGVSDCDNGLGRRSHWHCSGVQEGDFDKSRGKLDYKPKSDDVDLILDDLSLLLTAGRLSEGNRDVIKKAYTEKLLADGTDTDEAAFRVALQLLAAAPEFHTTNLVQPSATSRPTPPGKGNATRPYKAVVYFFMSGGCDSYNVLVPHETCQLYEEYKEKRGHHALKASDMELIDASDSEQPCDSFGVHKKIGVLEELYNDKEAVFFANTGMLFEPVTLGNYMEKTKTQLYAHDVQRRMVKQSDPYEMVQGTGVFGRAANALTKAGFKACTSSMDTNTCAVDGEDGKFPVPRTIATGGIHEFDPHASSDEVLPSIRKMNNATSLLSGFFSETWSRSVVSALHESEEWVEQLSDVPTPTGFPDTKLGKQLQTVARLVDARGNRGVERDVFYVSTGNWDMHDELRENLGESLEEVNDALKAFKLNMQKQGLWDNVVFIASSEFGRTITPNSSNGTDHAWAGNYFMAGGSVKGGKILGQYPANFHDLDVGRGRLIPTTSHDQYLNAVVSWLGVDPSDMDHVLPNRNKFDLFDESHLFHDKDGATELV